MLLKNLINKSVYGTIGYISSLEDLDRLEQYIILNLPILKQYKNIISSTTYGEDNLHRDLEKVWKKYFPSSIHINLGKSRSHSFGAADNDNAIIDYCKDKNIKWLCKSANDIMLNESILDIEITKKDFYYLNGIGYGGLVNYQFDYDNIIKECFYPQTNFYFIDVSKIDYLNNKEYINETYKYIQSIPDYNGKIWEYIKGWTCEDFLKQCVERNKLTKYHLIPENKYRELLQIVQHYQIHDSSHKNIMIEGICHFQYPDQPILEL